MHPLKCVKDLYLVAGFFAYTRVRILCSDLILKNILEEKHRKQEILDGISQNLSYRQIAYNIGIRRRALIRDINAMRRTRDPELLDAQRVAENRIDEEKKAASKTREKKFYDMTGMTLIEKSFQNMVNFYKPELIHIINSDDQIAAVRKLPTSVRKTLTKNNILTKRGNVEVTQKALEKLL